MDRTRLFNIRYHLYTICRGDTGCFGISGVPGTIQFKTVNEGLHKDQMWYCTVGDFMHALNVCHRYCYDYNLGQVNLEMHWEHDEDYIYHPKDPETIVERMTWIHEKYKEPERVLVTHVFNSMEFHYDDVDQKVKRRFEFDNDRYDPTGAPPNDWVFAEREWIKPEKRIVIWTPSYNKEQPRRWKRWLTEDDWSDIIERV